MVRFEIYEYKDPLRYVDGRFINLHQLSKSEMEELVRRHPNIVVQKKPQKSVKRKSK